MIIAKPKPNSLPKVSIICNPLRPEASNDNLFGSEDKSKTSFYSNYKVGLDIIERVAGQLGNYLTAGTFVHSHAPIHCTLQLA